MTAGKDSEGKEREEKIRDLSEFMETFRKYQIIQYILIFLPEVVISMISVNYIFTVGDVNYRCRIDQCEDANSTAKFPTWWPDTTIDRCSAPVLKSGVEVCTNNSFTGQITTCNQWIYESYNTVVAEFDLACQPWKSNVIGTVHCLGMLFSMLIFGWVSDKFGRKPTLIITIVAGSVGNLKTFATSYYMYVVIEFIEALVSGGFYTAAMVMLLEIAGKKYRLLSGITSAYSIYFGEFLLACAAMFAPHWKTLIYMSYGSCVFFIVFMFFINESPRWQIVNGKIDEAKKTMKRIAEVNKIRINDEELENIDEATLKEKFDIRSNQVKESLIHAFKCKEILKRLFVAGASRFTSNFVYNGMMINSVWLPGNKYTNFLLTTLMSFPGELLSLYLMNKIGRKLPLLVGLLSCGVLCIILAFIPSTCLWAKLTVFLIAKIIISSCFTGAITYTMELFPTSVRASFLGLTSFCSRFGGMLAPLTPILNTVSEALPFVIFGCTLIVSGLLLILTPETKNMPLFDTVSQIKSYSKDKAQQQKQEKTRM